MPSSVNSNMHYYEVRYRRRDRPDLHTEWSAFRTKRDAQDHLLELRSVYFIAHMRPISRDRYLERIAQV